MSDLSRCPVEFPDLYVGHSRLADARIPPPATVTHIYRAKRWRSQDERRGDGYSRRLRIRQRKARREPIVFDHAMRTDDPRRVRVWTPPSLDGGRAA